MMKKLLGLIAVLLLLPLAVKADMAAGFSAKLGDNNDEIDYYVNYNTETYFTIEASFERYVYIKYDATVLKYVSFAASKSNVSGTVNVEVVSDGLLKLTVKATEVVATLNLDTLLKFEPIKDTGSTIIELISAWDYENMAANCVDENGQEIIDCDAFWSGYAVYSGEKIEIDLTKYAKPVSTETAKEKPEEQIQKIKDVLLDCSIVVNIVLVTLLLLSSKKKKTTA
jgi:hypothetical protein